MQNALPDSTGAGKGVGGGGDGCLIAGTQQLLHIGKNRFVYRGDRGGGAESADAYGVRGLFFRHQGVQCLRGYMKLRGGIRLR